jgi:hypothetical protein
MEIEHHDLDIHPVPENRQPLFVNETWLADKYSYESQTDAQAEKDNVRIYIPLDLNKNVIMERLDRIICHYGEANESNESAFEFDVQTLIWQIEIYDQVWYARHVPASGSHSVEVKELVREFVAMLEEIPDGCAERFPFELIDELKEEFLDD